MRDLLISLREFFERIRDRYRTATTPQTVDRAPRRERWKRQAWMFGSLLLTGAVVMASVVGAQDLGFPGYTGPLLISIFLLHSELFEWGMERFDLTPPWQFREADVSEGDESDDQETPS